CMVGYRDSGARLVRVNSLHDAELEPLRLGDPQAGTGEHPGGPAGQVLTGGPGRDHFEQSLRGPDRPPAAANVVEQEQAAARAEYPRHLRDRGGVVGDRAQRQRAYHRVEAAVVERQRLRVGLPQVGVEPEVGGPLLGEGEHRRTELYPGDRGTGRVEGKVAAGADRDLQHPAGGTGTHPLPATAEQEPFEQRDPAVIARRQPVPHSLDGGGAVLLGLHRALPTRAGQVRARVARLARLLLGAATALVVQLSRRQCRDVFWAVPRAPPAPSPWAPVASGSAWGGGGRHRVWSGAGSAPPPQPAAVARVSIAAT